MKNVALSLILALSLATGSVNAQEVSSPKEISVPSDLSSNDTKKIQDILNKSFPATAPSNTFVVTPQPGSRAVESRFSRMNPLEANKNFLCDAACDVAAASAAAGCSAITVAAGAAACIAAAAAARDYCHSRC